MVAIRDKNYYQALEILKTNPIYQGKFDLNLRFLQKSALRQREIMLNWEVYGDVIFFLVLSLKLTNTFFTLYYKATKLPQKVFVLAKSSVGYSNRAVLRKSGNKDIERGRYKTNMQHIYNRLNMFRGFLLNMFVINQMCFHYFKCMVLYKLYRQPDLIVQKLIEAEMPCEFLADEDELDFSKKVKNPFVHYNYDIKYCFPHGGCRPKGKRRIKKKISKLQQKLLTKRYLNVEPDIDMQYLHDLNKHELADYVRIVNNK